MDVVLFNTHDVVLLFTFLQCIVLAFILYKPQKERAVSNVFLLAFLLSNAVIPFELLIHFGAAFRPWAIDHLPNWFFVFEFGYWLQGPFLLWYLRSVLYKTIRVPLSDAFYFVPFVLFLLHQVIGYHILSTDEKISIQQSFKLHTESFSIYYITLMRELLRVYFGVLCLLELKNYLKVTSQKHIVADTSDVLWLRIVVYGFLGVWGWSVLVVAMLICNVQFLWHLPVGTMGIMANYVTCGILCGLVVVVGRKARVVENLEPVSSSQPKQHAGVTINLEYVEQLEKLMHEDKLYLESSLTLEVLAGKLSISPRTLSTVINRHYGCNFFEFINDFRIEDAKKRMVDPARSGATMLDIMYEVGFNSKATFNSFFKKHEGMTPREYRKKNTQAKEPA